MQATHELFSQQIEAKYSILWSEVNRKCIGLFHMTELVHPGFTAQALHPGL